MRSRGIGGSVSRGTRRLSFPLERISFTRDQFIFYFLAASVYFIIRSVEAYEASPSVARAAFRETELTTLMAASAS